MKKLVLSWFSGPKLAVILPLIILSCAAPVAFDSESGEVPINRPSADLVRQGEATFAAYKRSHPVSRDQNARARVMRVARQLVPVVPGQRWEIEVFADDSANAFALPGGKVGVHTGLLKVAQTDGQLAAAIAHEMAHVTANHAQSRIQNQQNIEIGTAIIGAVLGGQQGGAALGQMAGVGGKVLFGLPFSRQQELEADKAGAIFMARAGFDPYDSVKLWERMSARQGQNVEFLSTHPMGATRIQALKAFMPIAERQRR